MTKSAKRNIIISAILAIIMCACLVTGATFALFTSESSVNIAVTSGMVNVVATVDDGLTLSHKEADSSAADGYKEVTGSLWGGTAELDENNRTLTIDKMVPMDKISFKIKVENKSNVAIKYRTVIMCAEDNDLFGGLTVTIKEDNKDAVTYEGRTTISNYTTLEAGAAIDPATINVTIEMAQDKGNEYQDKSCTISYKVEAIQGNAAVSDPDENTLEIYTVSDLKWFQKNANTLTLGSTVKLMNDIDLGGADWAPINWSAQGKNKDYTFDGNNKTISNFVVNENKANPSKESPYKDLGLFGTTSCVKIKDVTIDTATVSGIGRVGALVGQGMCTHIDNCHVIDSTITATPALNASSEYDDGDKAGAIVGQLTSQNRGSIENCSVSGCTIKAYRDLGGLAGHVQNSSAVVQNNTVEDTTVIEDLTLITTAKGTTGKIVGRQDGGFVLDTTKNTASDDVNITVECSV